MYWSSDCFGVSKAKLQRRFHLSLTFSIDNIRALLLGGYVDGTQVVEDYLASRCSVPPSQLRLHLR